MDDFFPTRPFHDDISVFTYFQQADPAVRCAFAVSLSDCGLAGFDCRNLPFHDCQSPRRQADRRKDGTMNSNIASVAAISIIYTSLIFLIAWYAHHRKDTGRSIISNPVIYSLSLGVYCTSWTFFGSVGK